MVTAGEPVPALYETGTYRVERPRLMTLAAPAVMRFERRRLKFVRGLRPPPADLLDAGAGRGRFVAEAARAGYRARGIEPSARGVESAAEDGVELQRAGIDDAAIAASSLDIVSLWHVLEHLEDAEAALARIHAWLRPGGLLLVGVPNAASLQARLFGTRWFHLDVPRHRTHFTPEGLSALLGRSGFEILESHHLLAEHNPFGMWQSLLNLVTRERAYFYNFVKRNAAARPRDLLLTLLAVPLAPLACLLEAAAGSAGHGGTVAVLARRMPVPERAELSDG